MEHKHVHVATSRTERLVTQGQCYAFHSIHGAERITIYRSDIPSEITQSDRGLLSLTRDDQTFDAIGKNAAEERANAESATSCSP